MTRNEARLWGAQLSPSGLATVVTDGTYQRPPHIRLFDHLAIEIDQERLRRVVVNVPPQHGKSEFWSKYFTAWYLGRHPDRKIILSTYADGYAQSWSREARNLLTEHGQELYKVRVADDSSAVNWWHIQDNKGGMAAVGTGGQATGKGAHVFVVDDPVKGPEDAMSPTMQRRNVDWYRSVATTRLQPNGAIVIIQTRWDADDLTGKLLNPEEFPDADTWTVISLPALALPGDLLGREEGAALWPERYGIDELREKKAALGTRWFEALYQQGPTRESEAALWKRQWIKHVPESKRADVLKNARRVVVGIDPAVTSTEHSDENGIIVCARGADGNAYVISDRSMRGSPLAWATRAIAAYDECGADRIIAETNQGGDMVLHTLRTVRRDVAVDGVTAHRGKALRADPVATLYEQGRVFHVGSFPELESQMLSWVPGEGDSPDRIDALVHALTYLFPQNPESKVWVL